MGIAGVSSVRRVSRVAPDLGSVAEFRADYSDAFSVPTTAASTASAWAHQSLRGADMMNGAFRQAVWHGVLGFDLAAAGTPDTFVGWQISTDRPERFVLEADGRLMRGRMVFEVSPTVVIWTTMLAFHQPAGARIWSVAGHVHRALARTLLARAAASLQRL